jgi:hypothetical protein
MDSTKMKKFNELTESFLTELSKQFPDSSELKTLKLKFKLSRNTINWIKIFMDAMRPHGKLIMEKDEQFLEYPLSNQLNIKPYYNKCTADNKNVIWAYLQTLYMLGCSYENFTPEFMEIIEQVSNKLDT